MALFTETQSNMNFVQILTLTTTNPMVRPHPRYKHTVPNIVLTAFLLLAVSCFSHAYPAGHLLE